MFTNEKATGNGIIMRDSRGQTIAAMSKLGPGIKNATTAEAMAAASKCTVVQNSYRFTI